MPVGDVDFEAVAAVAAGLSAIAAMLAARASLSAVRRSNEAFVYAEPGREWRERDALTGTTSVFNIRYHNDGPGMALRVRARVEACDTDWIGDVTSETRSLQGGETFPPIDFEGMEIAPPPLDVGAWVVVTRYMDNARRHWEIRNQREPEAPLVGPTRLRGRRFEWWRPARDW